MVNFFYRGINVSDIVEGFQAEDRRGYEETAYLLLFGELPNKEELYEFNQILDENRTLPQHFTENMILKIPSSDIMNKLQRSVLVLYSHDENPDDISVKKRTTTKYESDCAFPYNCFLRVSGKSSLL